MARKHKDDSSERFWHLLAETKAFIPQKAAAFEGELRILAADFALQLFVGNPLDDAIAIGFERTGLDPRDPMQWKTLLGLFCLAHFGETPKVAAPRTWDIARLQRLLTDADEIRKRHPALSDTAIATALKTKEIFKDVYGGFSVDTIRERIREAKKSREQFETLRKKHLEIIERVYHRVGLTWTPALARKHSASFDEMRRRVLRLG